MIWRSRSAAGLSLCRVGVVRLLVVLVLAGTAVSCSPDYVARAAFEEARILWRRQPIEGLLQHGNLDADRKAKLEMVLAARRFADVRLGLRVGGSYGSISDVDRSAVVQLLTAARRDRLEPYTWWFPVVGTVPYKGFFSKEEATVAAESLERRGYDTYLRPAVAFSTLGWFDDPLLSSLLRRDRVTLANVVFHELFHNTLFVPGEVAFNESAANFVGSRSSMEFFCGGPAPSAEDCREASADWRDSLTVSRFLADALARLQAFYATHPRGAALESGRSQIFEEIRGGFTQLELQSGRYEEFRTGPLNNAILLHDRTYLRDLDLFEELYRQGGDVRHVVRTLRDALRAGGDPFERLQSLLGRRKWETASAFSTVAAASPPARLR